MDTAGDRTVTTYLLQRSAEFRRLSELRQKGWENPEGDAFFQKQRQQADRGDDTTAEFFYKLMKGIGNELHQYTGAFTIRPGPAETPTILDICMAPGGFLQTAINKNQGARAMAFSLPSANGGHKVLLEARTNIEQRFLDVTMLAADLDAGDIPKEHPDAGNFLPRQLEPSQKFHLVLCDGQVLRTHTRAEYRERREARRLKTAQLALALDHLTPGGTIIVLLQKVEAWDTIILLWRFHQFSSIRLFKPTKAHAKRSSFYMVATNVQSRQPEAIQAIDGWKKTWNVATFGSDEEYQQTILENELCEEELLKEFGPTLVEWGRDIWRIQADALANAPFIRSRGRTQRSRSGF